jgi:hypothetical protein
MSPLELRSEKFCAGDAQQKIEKYKPDFSSERAPHINKTETVKKIIKERMGKKLVAGPRYQDGLTDRLSVIM